MQQLRIREIKPLPQRDPAKFKKCKDCLSGSVFFCISLFLLVSFSTSVAHSSGDGQRGGLSKLLDLGIAL